MFSKRFCFVITAFIVCLNIKAQRPTESSLVSSLSKISQKYIAVNLKLPLSIIIDSISKNPEIVIDTVIAHSDSTFFYLRGYHRQFNPFDTELDSVRTIIAETKRTILRQNSSDTLLFFQIEGIAVGERKMKNISNRFNTLYKEFNPHFHYSSYSKTKKAKTITGESMSYYLKGYPTITTKSNMAKKK